MVEYFDKNFKASFDVMYPMINEDNLFNEMPDIIGEEYANAIVPILNVNQRDKLSSVLKTV